MSTAAKTAGLAAQNRMMNHSICKMSVSCRLDTGVPGNFVMQLSGHKIVQSLSLYKSATLTHQQHNVWYFEQKIDE